LFYFNKIELDGRRRVYLISLPISIIGSLGVAAAKNMPELLFWRIWQCAGASPGLAVGAAVIGDVFKLEERGTAMGFFLAVSLHIAKFVSGAYVALREGYKYGTCSGATNWRYVSRRTS
jgi:MFS family permease